MSDLSGDSDVMLSSASESSGEEDLEVLLDADLRPKNTDYFEQIIPQYSNEIFIEHFRVSRPVANLISERFAESNYYSTHTGCYGTLSAQNAIYIYLWFVGHQTASFRDVADVTISTLFRIIRRVSYFLSNLSPEVIHWPSENEKNDIERHFRHNGFLGVIGAIDGSHVKIDKPADDPESYLNRKGYYSIQMQVVCDHNLQIRDIFVGFPGSVHDSRVFRSSPLWESIHQKCDNFYLLGDSGYPLLNNLMTPFKDSGHLTRAQSHYNVTLAKNRYCIEHCFGVLKQKFRQLYHIKLRKIADVVHLIHACCVLHNFALNDDVQLNEDGPAEPRVQPMINDIDDDPDAIPDDRNAIQHRNHIVNLINDV